MPRNILYIDDDEGLRRLVSRGLEREGNRVVCASDGESGLKALAAEEFDVIALEQNMPSLDGLSTRARIQQAGFDAVPLETLHVKDCLVGNDRCDCEPPT